MAQCYTSWILKNVVLTCIPAVLLSKHFIICSFVDHGHCGKHLPVTCWGISFLFTSSCVMSELCWRLWTTCFILALNIHANHQWYPEKTTNNIRYYYYFWTEKNYIMTCLINLLVINCELVFCCFVLSNFVSF